jgi:hypothetical protein
MAFEEKEKENARCVKKVEGYFECGITLPK